jgi:hypothetical protein
MRALRLLAVCLAAAAAAAAAAPKLTAQAVVGRWTSTIAGPIPVSPPVSGVSSLDKCDFSGTYSAKGTYTESGMCYPAGERTFSLARAVEKENNPRQTQPTNRPTNPPTTHLAHDLV